MRKLLTYLIALFLTIGLNAQNKPLSELTVEEIMQDPAQFVGNSPGNFSWSRDSKSIFFSWNPDGGRFSSTYQINFEGGTAEKVDDRFEGWPEDFEFNSNKSQIVYESGNDIFLMDVNSKEETQLTSTNAEDTNPKFFKDDQIVFTSDDNLFLIDLSASTIKQVTNFDFPEDETSNRRTSSENRGNRSQDNWLRRDQALTSSHLKSRRNRGTGRSGIPRFMSEDSDYLSEISVDNVSQVKLSPDGKYVSFRVYNRAENPAQRTIVPNYVTQSGYTTDLNARPKVGGERGNYEIGIYNIEADTFYMVDHSQLPGIQDLPDYTKDYPDKTWEKKDRLVSANDIIWSEDGKYAVVHFGSIDNKDRWIMRLLPNSGDLIDIDRQRDEAWIAGPGIGNENFSGVFGFLPDNKTIYFQSEESGYSHLYTFDISRGVKKQLTKGEFEVYSPFLSSDGKTWYFTANMPHPGIRHFYSMPLKGGNPTQITSLEGNNTVTLSPDETKLAIRYSYIDQPWELYVQENKPNSEARRLTESQKPGFKSYQWHKPEIITFKAEDGADVYSRIYKPENPNGAAVIFVHGAGYLQNVHYWWSSYFREYMFNNMLMAKGYTVLDIDYRASSGYGRDWRTGIYRYMGGKDLSDQIDGAKFLVEEYGIDADRIGMYGGSYGGFITLFAMFKHPDVIASGAALRSVTDWAHYNHGYTSNILNTPVEDPLSFKRSSPIYFAEGLEGDLLIAHGMVDTNVHFQDVVRLAQRLIELGKDNWEMAVYPVENHGFNTPSGWTDEYKRILKLFENTIGKE